MTTNRTSRFTPQERLIAGILKGYQVTRIERLVILGRGTKVFWGTEREHGGMPPGLFEGLKDNESLTPDEIIMEGEE